MDVLILLVFVSLVLALSGMGLFAWLTREKTFEHVERVALLPMDDAREHHTRAETHPKER
jgi:cbb3-type cytochrome oxidase maturation protein